MAEFFKELTISSEIILPFYSYTLNRHSLSFTPVIKYGDVDFSVSVVDESRDDNEVTLKVLWQNRMGKEYPIGAEFLKKMAEKALSFVNFMIYEARPFDFRSTEMGLLSPKSVPVVTLILGTGGDRRKERIPMQYEPPEAFRTFFEGITESGAFDVFIDLMNDPNRDLANLQFLNLLVDAFHAIYESRFNEAVINCMTAVEMRMAPLLKKWLLKSFVSQSPEKADEALIDMRSYIKYEILFGSIAPSKLKTETVLLEKLKGVTKMRNDIIHNGKRATKGEAILCLETVSRLIELLHYPIEI